jgi:cell division protein FtsI/penicillin-binding protein 2
MRSVVFVVGLLLTYTSVCGQRGEFYIEELLKKSTNPVVQQVLANPNNYKLKLLLTPIIKSEATVTYTYGNLSNYYYPASFVKLPTAIAACNFLDAVDAQRTNDSTFICIRKRDIGCGFSTERAVYDSLLYDDSFASIITRMLTVSDNTAYNMLYELMGQDFLNAQLQKMGLQKSFINKKLGACDTTQLRHTGPVSLYNNVHFFNATTDSIITTFPLTSKYTYRKNENAIVGKAHIANGKRIKKGIDFTYGNNIAIDELHQLMLGLYSPNTYLVNTKYVPLIKNSMLHSPHQSGIASYTDTAKYSSTYNKYFFREDEKGMLPAGYSVYNKVAMAYGFLGDCAYIENKTEGLRYFLTASIYCNANETLNDGKYEYTTVGFPFLVELRKLIEADLIATKP